MRKDFIGTFRDAEQKLQPKHNFIQLLHPPNPGCRGQTPEHNPANICTAVTVHSQPVVKPTSLVTSCSHRAGLQREVHTDPHSPAHTLGSHRRQTQPGNLCCGSAALYWSSGALRALQSAGLPLASSNVSTSSTLAVWTSTQTDLCHFSPAFSQDHSTHRNSPDQPYSPLSFACQRPFRWQHCPLYPRPWGCQGSPRSQCVHSMSPLEPAVRPRTFWAALNGSSSLKQVKGDCSTAEDVTQRV